MMIEILPLLLLGFALGLIHALDADHIMAVSMLSSGKRNVGAVLTQSASWALGHSGVLIVSGVLLFGLGLALPSNFQQLAEIAVGILLIVLGLTWAIRFRKEKLKLETHVHGDITHMHWHEDTREHQRQSNHKPVFVGMLHGLAGSAPAMALIPAVANGQLLQALFYLAVFSLGLTLSMLAFGLGFAHIQRFLSQRYTSVFHAGQQLLAFISIGLGGVWLVQAI